MNLTRHQLAVQYTAVVSTTAWDGDYTWVHDVERTWNLPPYILFGMWSRETNMDTRYAHGLTGDNGYGHGPWQLDNHPQNANPQRNADCKRIDDGDVVFAANKAAEMIQASIKRCGSIEGGLNAYNSGGCSAGGTAGGDYGPDTLERMLTLRDMFGVPPPSAVKRWTDDPGDE